MWPFIVGLIQQSIYVVLHITPYSTIYLCGPSYEVLFNNLFNSIYVGLRVRPDFTMHCYATQSLAK